MPAACRLEAVLLRKHVTGRECRSLNLGGHRTGHRLERRGQDGIASGALRETSSISQRVRRLGAALLILLMAAAVGGCGGSEEPGGAGGAQATTAAPAPTAATPTISEPVVLADGRHPVYLKTVDPDRPTITFDLIQFFTGEAATKAAAEDGEESPPPNDYYIRNVNPGGGPCPCGPTRPLR
jgi:hypothetical protein